MPIELNCSQCSRKLRVADNLAGKRIKCPECQHVLAVPYAPASASSTQDVWRVLGEDGVAYGPVARAELDDWVREGRLGPRCQLAREGDAQWRWASEVYPELSRGSMVKPRGPESDKSLVAALLLCVLLPLAGLNGIHRMYLGHVGIGILQLITCGGCGIWQLIDLILLAVGSVRDADGLPLRN